MAWSVEKVVAHVKRLAPLVLATYIERENPRSIP
jgi:hypothetical protein